MYFFVFLAGPQSNSWQLENTNQDSTTSTVNTPMDCKGKIICIICKKKKKKITYHKYNYIFKWIK